MKRYTILLALVVVAAFSLTWLARSPLAARPEPTSAPPRATVIWEVRIAPDGTISPEVLSAPKSARAVLRVRNADIRPHALRLLGYEDVLPELRIEAGASVERRVQLDRPADDLMLEMDGRPAVRVAVLGSHLVEDHR